MARLDRRKLNRNISYYKEFSAGHEETKSRQYHHNFLISGAKTTSQSTHSVLRSQAGIQILTQDIAAQVGPCGVRVNCITPETILTERNQQRIPKERIQSLIDMHAIKRLGTPEDVAHAALFLASDEARWITGVILDVAGGAVMV